MKCRVEALNGVGDALYEYAVHRNNDNIHVYHSVEVCEGSPLIRQPYH